MSRPHGIDVSNWQGAFDWAPWKGQISFAAAKATEGTNFADAEFAHNWAGMKSIGVHRFAYHFAHTDKSVFDQAAFFVDTVKAQGLHTGDNFILDLEVNDGQTPATVSAWGNEFCHEVHKRAPGHRVLVYTYPYFAEQGNCADLGGYKLWIANYNVASPTVPAPWTDWTFWQYTDQGKGNIDHNVFNGTKLQLRHFCRTVG